MHETMMLPMMHTIIVCEMVRPRPRNDAPPAQPETDTPDVTQKAV